MAQGSRLTQEQVVLVAASLRHNPNWGAAADYAGVSDRVLRLYRERAEALETADKPLADLSEDERFYRDAVNTWREARSAGEKELIDAIRAAIDKDWKAADALLKKGWPDRYNERIELTGAGGGPIEISADELRRQIGEDLERIAAKREAAGPGEPPENGHAPRAGDDPQAP